MPFYKHHCMKKALLSLLDKYISSKGVLMQNRIKSYSLWQRHYYTFKKCIIHIGTMSKCVKKSNKERK